MIKKLLRFFMLYFVGRSNWTGLKYFFSGREYDLTNADVELVAKKLLAENLIGLTWRSTHLSSWLCLLGHYALTRRWIKYSHAWINTDDETSDPYGLKIWESVSEGAVTSPFWKVICCDRIALLKPKYVATSDWEEITKVLKQQQGKPYDVFCRYKDPAEINCCERVVQAILAINDRALPRLTKMMDEYKNLTPQMLIESGDFEIVLEIP